MASQPALLRPIDTEGRVMWITRMGLLALAALLPQAAIAGDSVHWRDRAVMSDLVYLRYHPDQRYRGQGIQAYARGDYAEALAHFTEAARYADKASQAFIASMYWEGRGVSRDPALAYAWIDLASERRSAQLLAYREQYWSQLNETERRRAIALGAGLLAQFGDEIAQDRLERILMKGQSRAAATRSAYLTVNGYVTWYEPKFWRPKQYWAWQDVLIREAMPHLGRTGTVEVGTMETVHQETQTEGESP